MKAVLDLAQTVTICVVGGGLIYAVLLIRRAIAEQRSGRKPSDERRKRPY